MIFIAIENGKIVDICNPLNNKITSIPDEDYLPFAEKGDWWINDTWDFQANDSLQDSPNRGIEIPRLKGELELKIEELEARIQALEGG